MGDGTSDGAKRYCTALLPIVAIAGIPALYSPAELRGWIARLRSAYASCEPCNHASFALAVLRRIEENDDACDLAYSLIRDTDDRPARAKQIGDQIDTSPGVVLDILSGLAAAYQHAHDQRAA